MWHIFFTFARNTPMMDISPDVFENTAVAFAGKTDGDLHKAKALFTLVSNNWLVNTGSSLTELALRLRLPVSPLFKYTIYNQFCGGETFDECKKTIRALEKRNVQVLLNYGVELKETEADFEKSLQQNLEAVEFAAKQKSVKAICVKPTGYGRFALFEKMQEGAKLTAAEKKEEEKIKARFHKLCKVAEEKSVALYIDAEESWIQNALDGIVEELMSTYNRKGCVVFNTFQHYRHDRLAYLKAQIENAKAGGYLLGAKLVRGAYMEKERERAKELGYPSPIHKNKGAVDADFDEAVKLCLDSLNHVYLCVASQNEASNLAAMREMDRRGIERSSPRVVFSQLYGMGENITFNQANLGFTATKYLPYGPVKDVIPYLMRRAQENTSVAGQTGRELALINAEIVRRKERC